MASAGKIANREMQASDLDAVLAIEFLSYSYPWSRGIFLDCIKSGYDCRVLCVGDEVVGHAVMSCAAGEAHLLNVCVRRDLQGQGFGRLLVKQVLKRAVIRGAGQLFLEVRPSNKVAINLYESLGFAQIGQRKGYYPADTGREDAWVLAITLGQGIDP